MSSSALADYTYASVLPMYALMGFFVASTLFCLLWAIQSGAVRNDESPKFRMLVEDVLAEATVDDERGAALPRRAEAESPKYRMLEDDTPAAMPDRRIS